jgi:hypothetical protein
MEFAGVCAPLLSWLVALFLVSARPSVLLALRPGSVSLCRTLPARQLLLPASCSVLSGRRLLKPRPLLRMVVIPGEWASSPAEVSVPRVGTARLKRGCSSSSRSL